MSSTLRILAVALACGACGSSADPLPTSSDGPAPFDPDTPYQPSVTAGDLSATVDNPLLPYPVGATWVYEANGEDGTERVEISVEADTRDTWGTSARVVRDTVYLGEDVIEDTWDWFAQDGAGHVWYLGEDTKEYEDGVEVCACGSWESGVDGALPGVVMLADPKVGDVYRQEYYAGEAEDLAEVVEVGVDVTVRAGSFSNCVVTRERSAIDSGLDERKYYCPGVGNVLVDEGGGVREELIEYSGL